MNRTAKTLLIAALVVVVGMAFRVSWNALRDVARAIGADHDAATLYPFVVDGLMALALVATLVLVDNDRRFALRVLAGYTVASLVLNYVHGLVPALHDQVIAWGRLADWSPANYALVLLATSLPVGSIFFGSDLVARVLHHRVPDAPAVRTDVQTEDVRTDAPAPVVVSTPDAPRTTAPDAPDTAADGPADAPADDDAPAAAQAASAPADETPAAPRPTVRTTPAAPRARQTPGVGRAARPVRSEGELLEHLQKLRTGADGPLSQRAVLGALGIGAPRLRALLDAHRLTLEPLPTPARPLALVADDDDQEQQLAAAAAL